MFAWRNSCPHKPNVPLDPGGGAIVDDEIEIAVRDGDVYLADERFDACTPLG